MPGGHPQPVTGFGECECLQVSVRVIEIELVAQICAPAACRPPGLHTWTQYSILILKCTERFPSRSTLIPLTGSSISHTLYHFLSFLISVSARPGGGVPRKARRHLTSAKCVREAPTAILLGLPPRGALGCVRPGSTVTTGTHSVRTAGKAGTSPSRTVLYACLAPSRRRLWGRAAPSVSATRGSLAVLQVEEAQERPR